MGPGFLHTTLSHTFLYLSFRAALHASEGPACKVTLAKPLNLTPETLNNP